MTLETPATLVPRTGWRDRAACVDTDPDDWDAPTGQPGSSSHLTVPAWQYSMCHGCPALVDCLAESYVLNDTEVVRGATVLGKVQRVNRDRLAVSLARVGVQV